MFLPASTGLYKPIIVVRWPISIFLTASNRYNLLIGVIYKPISDSMCT